MASSVAAPRGLEGIVAADSGVCYIDGEKGILAYRGIDIHELADHSTFEETCYLLWLGKLPTRAELDNLKLRLGAARKLDPAIVDIMRTVPKTATPIEVLRAALSALSLSDADAEKIDHDSNFTQTIRLTSPTPTTLAAHD